MGTGIGKNAYSIIEQGRIGLIVTAKPEDRRAFIEDAAGVSRYKARRKQAERRIQATEQNLLRITDITEELSDAAENARAPGEARRALQADQDGAQGARAAPGRAPLSGARHARAFRHEARRTALRGDDRRSGRARSKTEETRVAEAILAFEAARRRAARSREDEIHGHQQALALAKNNGEFLTRERTRSSSDRKVEAEVETAELTAERERLESPSAKRRKHDPPRRCRPSGGDEMDTLDKREAALGELTASDRRRDARRAREARSSRWSTRSRRSRSTRTSSRTSRAAGSDLETQIGRSLRGEEDRGEPRARGGGKKREQIEQTLGGEPAAEAVARGRARSRRRRLLAAPAHQISKRRRPSCSRRAKS